MKPSVLVAGAGPTGLTAALELARADHDVMIVDAKPSGANTSRAAVIHARTLEVLEPSGVTSELIERGLKVSTFTVRDRDRSLLSIGFGNLDTAYPYTLMLSQAETESVLVSALADHGVAVRRPARVVGVSQRLTGVQAMLEDGSVVAADYLVAADGAQSTVRDALGIPFTGGTYDESFVLADVRLTGGMPRDQVFLFFSPAGLVVVAPLPGGFHRVVATVDEAPESPGIEFVQSILDTRGPVQQPASVQQVLWGSRFRVHHRVADRFGEDRILLVGDAAHVHSPAGGQGMNLGIEDGSLAAAAVDLAAAGHPDAMSRYATDRPQVAASVVSLADRLTRLATAPHIVRPVRNTAIGLLDHSSRFKDTLAQQLAGLSRGVA
ncbi:NAD(P)/FAD-dependent oxidoreductase [Nocardioides sp. BE266]|uniref:FAD-dependent oxidoreductase n=1 Tax=Nocardioides sp. BE266 TaxID=2817725 RepID=UPI00286CF0CA|nr:NAD(P)/FAD-dependent oxidoreductase [Nocardioides sp. BE266]